MSQTTAIIWGHKCDGKKMFSETFSPYFLSLLIGMSKFFLLIAYATHIRSYIIRLRALMAENVALHHLDACITAGELLFLLVRSSSDSKRESK